MIILTKLNGNPFMLNDELIETIEEVPDTTIHLTTNRILIVRESMKEIIALVTKFRREVYQTPFTERCVQEEGLV